MGATGERTRLPMATVAPQGRRQGPAAAQAMPPPALARAGTAGSAWPAGRGDAGRIATLRQLQRSVGNQGVRQWLQASGTGLAVQRDLSVTDVIPDAVLRPIRQLVGQVSDFTSGITGTSDSAAATAQTDADEAARTVDGDATAHVDTAQAQGEAAAGQAQSQVATATAATGPAQAGGEAQAGQIHNALPAAQYASDPVRPALAGPPAGRLPGASTPPVSARAQDEWDCDEADVLSRVSDVGKGVLQRVGKVVKAVVPERVLAFAQQGMQRLGAVIGGLRQKVEAARQAVGQWIDGKLAPVRQWVDEAQAAVSRKFEAAKKAVSEKLSQAAEWAGKKWAALKSGVSSAVNGAVDWARRGIGGLVQRAKDLAGRLWDALPDVVKAPLTGALAALAAPISLAYKAIETATAWVQAKAATVRQKLSAAADRATQWFAAKYQSVRSIAVSAGASISQGLGWVKNKAAEAGRAVYQGLDKLSGGRLSKWRAAAAARLAALKGQACAVTGTAAGPCVERFVPEPVGDSGKSFASLTLKTDLTVPVEGVPVKVAAGAKITIERTSKQYRLILSGDGFAGVALDLSGGAPSAGGGGGGGGSSGSVTVDGTLPQRALALLSLSGQGSALPGVPVPIGGAKPPATATPAATPATAPGTAPAPGGGGGLKASAEVGEKVSVALTYAFDATADKTTCDGLGGLTAFLATQGAAAMLPPPFSTLAAAGGQAAFADKLVSAKITHASTGSLSAKGGAGGAEGSLGLKGESGASLEAKRDATGKSLVLTLFQALSGEGALSFAPEGVGLAKLGASLGGRQELAITYSITQDALNAAFKQALSGSATLSVFAGMLGALPPAVREPVRRMLACLPDANEATVSFELSNNVVNLAALATALDAELNKGAGATAGGVWDAVSGFLKDKANAYIEFSAKLALTEKVLGVKASGSSGSGADQVSVGGEAVVSRGQEIVICPPTKLLQDDGSGAGPAAPKGTTPTPAVAAAPPPRGPPAPAQKALRPFFHGSTWRIAQSIPGHVQPIGGGDFGQGFYTHHDGNTQVAAERARWEGCRLCAKLTPAVRYAGVVRFDVAPSDYDQLTNRRTFGLTTTTQPDYAARQKEWLDFVSGPGRGREACPVYDPAHTSWRHQRVDPPPDQGHSIIEGPMYKGVPGTPGTDPPPRSAFDPYAEGTALPQQVVWNHDQAIAMLNAAPTSLKQFDAANHCAPVDPPLVGAAAATGPAAEDARAREAAQAELTGG